MIMKINNNQPAKARQASNHVAKNIEKLKG
jgi:hypothetical protein